MTDNYEEILKLMLDRINTEYDFSLPSFPEPKKEKASAKNLLLNALVSLSELKPEPKAPVLKGGDVVGLGLAGTTELLKSLNEQYRIELENYRQEKQLQLAKKQVEYENQYKQRQIELQQAGMRMQYMQMVFNSQIAKANLEIAKNNALANILSSINARDEIKIKQEQLNIQKQLSYLQMQSLKQQIKVNMPEAEKRQKEALTEYYQALTGKIKSGKNDEPGTTIPNNQQEGVQIGQHVGPKGEVYPDPETLKDLVNPELPLPEKETEGEKSVRIYPDLSDDLRPQGVYRPDEDYAKNVKDIGNILSDKDTIITKNNKTGNITIRTKEGDVIEMSNNDFTNIIDKIKDVKARIRDK